MPGISGGENWFNFDSDLDSSSVIVSSSAIVSSSVLQQHALQSLLGLQFVGSIVGSSRGPFSSRLTIHP